MIKITKNEAMYIRKMFPFSNAIYETNRHKPARARTYFMIEDAQQVKRLESYRNSNKKE